jgi:tRNA (guanine-N(7)-)-methyltransferase subunit TRM82
MSTYNVPYQYLQASGNVLFAARGSTIDLFSLENGSLLSTWSSTTHAPGSTNLDSPPAKRRKLSKQDDNTKDTNTQAHVTNEESQETKKETKQNSRANAVASGLDGPAVACLQTSSDGKYVVAVTAEDKSLRVFELVENHGTPELKQRSVR